MKKFNFFSVAVLSLLLLLYSIAVDLILTGKIYDIYFKWPSMNFNVFFMLLGLIVFYSCFSVFFNFNFVKLIMGKCYPQTAFFGSKYRLVPVGTVFYLFVSGYITLFVIPMMLLVIIECSYLCFIRKEIN
ncbi:hypothetical protein [uncultured Shewanella sp.]|uniref:hypothetical protein n=1 Tax=uncultured Shewanella sp. TaxID=173975 RepID=UPI0026192430|nr:hypothetical protein [uncultured Shewanella sp.]